MPRETDERRGRLDARPAGACKARQQPHAAHKCNGAAASRSAPPSQQGAAPERKPATTSGRGAMAAVTAHGGELAAGVPERKRVRLYLSPQPPPPAPEICKVE